MTLATRNGAFPRDARSAAELYLLKGLAPISLPFRSKDPGYPNWQRLRLSLDALDEHFPDGEVRNVGILNGAPSGDALDVDLDCPEALLAAGNLLPPTEWVFGRKSAPESHRIYRADRPLEAAQEKFTDLDGGVLIELRGSGGLTVYPPSTHKDTGEAIAWERFGEAGEVALADLRRAVREVAAVSLLARHWPAKGTRQDAFLALVGGLLRAGWERERTERFVEALALATSDEEPCKRVQVVKPTAAKLDQDLRATGWPRLGVLIGSSGGEVLKRVPKWLALPPASSPGTIASTKAIVKQEEYQPFPVDALPAPIGEYVRQEALALGCDPAFLALPALAVAASAIGNTRTIRLKRGWEEPSVLWTAIVGDSGTLKSPALSKAAAHVFRLQQQSMQAYREKLAKYREDEREYQAAKKKAKGDGSGAGAPPEKPVARRVVCSDTTIEKLAEILEENPRGTLVVRDELAAWLGSFTRYKGQKGGTDLPNWLEMHRAGTVIVDRKTGERNSLFIERAAVSVTGGIQPGVLARALTPECLDSGLAARILMAMPPRSPKRWTEIEVAPEVEQAFHDGLASLMALDFDSRKGQKAPHVLRLSPEGKAAWIAFYNAWALEQAAVEGELAAAFSKLEGYAARFSLLHHVVGRIARDDDDLVPVGRESVDAGVTLCRWFSTEARRIYTILAESEEQRDTRRLVDFIQTRGGKITARELQRSNDRKYPKSQDAEAALENLIKAGVARWQDRPDSPRGGNTARVLELCRTPDTSDTCPVSDDNDRDGTPETVPDTIAICPTVGDPAISDRSAANNYTKTAYGRCAEAAPGQVSEVSGRRVGEEVASSTSESLVGVDSSSGGSVGSSLKPEVAALEEPAYLVIDAGARLAMVTAAIGDSTMVALDLETTGLDPRTDRVRLVTVATDTIDGGTFCYLIDCFAIDPSPLWEALADKELVLHNAAFDLSFLSRLGFIPGGKVRDTMLLAQLLTAGTMEKVSLAACCRRWLRRDLDKTEQKADWSGRLTEDQLTYAALDVAVLAPLLKVLVAKVKEAGLVEAARIEHRCLPAIVWMAGRGVALDKDAWQSLARIATDDADRLSRELDEAAPRKPGELFDAWNWDSAPQVRRALDLAGCQVENTADETLAAVDHPLAGILRRYRMARKRGSTYGDAWLTHVADDGRVYPGWRQIGAASGRMSCREPNMQQLPRGDYRRCVSAPPGRVLVKADYSQIELRVAAKVSGDEALLKAYQRGDDLHTCTAHNVLGIEDVTKQHRQLAKALNFGLLYGMGAKTFREYAKTNYGLELSPETAASYRAAFFAAYPGLAAWHRRTGGSGRDVIETRTLAGRRRLGVARFTEKLNTPVQGTGADGLKLALALLWERRDQAPGAVPVMAVHDEIVVESDANRADMVVVWLKSAMVEAMAPLVAPVPVEVEVKVSVTWGGD